MISGFGDFIKQVLLHFRKIEMFRYQLVNTSCVPRLFCGDKFVANLQNAVRNSHRSQCKHTVLGAMKDIVHDLANPAQPRTAPGFLVEALRLRRAAKISAFTVLCCLFAFTWLFITPFQMRFAFDADTSGRVASLIPAAQVFGIACGPLVASFFVEGEQAHAVPFVSAAFGAMAMLTLCLRSVVRRRALSH